MHGVGAAHTPLRSQVALPATHGRVSARSAVCFALHMCAEACSSRLSSPQHNAQQCKNTAQLCQCSMMLLSAEGLIKQHHRTPLCCFGRTLSWTDMHTVHRKLQQLTFDLCEAMTSNSASARQRAWSITGCSERRGRCKSTCAGRRPRQQDVCKSSGDRRNDEERARGLACNANALKTELRLQSKMLASISSVGLKYKLRLKQALISEALRDRSQLSTAMQRFRSSRAIELV